MGDQGYLGINKPAKYGGMGLDYSYQLVFLETLGHIRCGGVPMAIGVQTDMATPALARFGSEELCKEFLVPSIKGDYVACLGVSEVGAGSDVASIKTTAQKDGDDYVINGGKMWTTSGTQADWMCLLANTSDGPAHKNKSLICLPMKTKGVQVARKLDKIGMRSSDTAQIFFEDVRVPQRYRIGKEGEGFTYQMLQFQEERLYAAAAGLVAKERMIEETIEYTRPAQGVRPVDPRQPGGALPPGGAQDRGGDAARHHLSRGRADAEGRGRDHAGLHGQAEIGAAVARDLRRLPAVLGRHGLHERDQHLARLSRHAARLHRRRRRRDHAVHHLQAHGHPAGQAEQVASLPHEEWGDGTARGCEMNAMAYETLIVERDGPVMKVTLNRPECAQCRCRRQMLAELGAGFRSRRATTPSVRVARADGGGRQFLRRRRLQGHAEVGCRAGRRHGGDRCIQPPLRRVPGDGRHAAQGRDLR